MAGRGGELRLRVHFAPVDHRQVQRIVIPAIQLKADVVFLLTVSRTDQARPALEKVIEYLSARRTRHHVIECNVWDSAVVTSEIGTVVAAAREHEYFFNASTGPRPACIGGTIASMLWPIRPYYVPLDRDAQPVSGAGDFPVRGGAVFIPTFETPSLDRKAVETLEFIATREQPLSKKQLMEHMVTAGSVGPRDKVQVTPQAIHAQADVILRRLGEWGFVDMDGRGKSLRIQVTPMGRAGSKMFHHVLYPRPAPAVLTLPFTDDNDGNRPATRDDDSVGPTEVGERGGPSKSRGSPRRKRA